MEQKQLDELDESFFSEEFIDDEPLDITKPVSSAVKEKTDKKSLKKSKLTKTNKSTSTSDSIKSSNNFEVDFDSLEGEKEEIEIKPVKVKETTKSKETNNTKSTSKAPVETSSPVNPWANEDEKKEPSFFEETSTWKVIAGILGILFIFSVKESSLTSAQAQEKTLAYVNNNLLRPPFVAEARNTTQVDSLYKVSLSVADQNFDTYLTKDGKYLFLQGFDTSTPLKGAASSLKEEQSVPKSAPAKSELKPASTIEEPTKDSLSSTPQSSTSQNSSSSENKVETKIEPKVTYQAETTASSSTSKTSTTQVTSTTSSSKKELTITAKKWFFSPSKLTVNKGDKVILTIFPENLDFTFSIPELKVEKEIKGKTVVEFTASQSGSFDYSCGTCEDYRGMSGILTVE
jgi:plastocyanin